MFTGVAMVTTVFKNRSVNFRKPWLPWQRPQWAIWAEEGDIWCMGDYIITAILVVIIGGDDMSPMSPMSPMSFLKR